MKILQLISTAGYYGAEALVFNLLTELRNAGCEVHLGVFCNSRAPNRELYLKAKEAGFPVCLFECKGRFHWKLVGRLKAHIAAHRIEILHTHGYKADSYGYLATRGSSVRLVGTCHNWLDTTLSLRVYGIFDRLILRKFDTVVGVSEEILKRLDQPAAGGRRTVIDNGIDVLGFASATPTLRHELGASSRPIIGMVGRLSSEKCPHTFIKAASAVLPDYPDCLFVLVGDGPERHALETLTRQLRLNGRLLFLGYRKDMSGVYASLDALVVPSRTEGMPMTIIEAMAAGIPVIASCVGAIPQLVRDHETGLLVKPGCVSSLTAALIELLADAHCRKSYGTAAKRLVLESFSSQIMGAKYVASYLDILSRSESSPRIS